VAVAAPLAAQAQQAGLGGWSLVGAETISGRPVVDIQAGWPSTTFGYTFGFSQTSDLGLRVGMLYGYEGTTDSQFGMAFYAPLRFQLSRGPRFKLLFHVDPGLKFYTFNPMQFGFMFPVGLVLGFPAQSGLELGVAADFNMALMVTGDFSPWFIFGPLVGPYVEYHVNPQVAIGLNTRFGAAIEAYSSQFGISGGTQTKFAFQTQLFVGYRL
jgi:hypothetical protein